MTDNDSSSQSNTRRSGPQSSSVVGKPGAVGCSRKTTSLSGSRPSSQATRPRSVNKTQKQKGKRRHNDYGHPTEFISAATLQQANPVAISFDSQTLRFRQNPSATQFANTVAVTTSFKSKDPFHRPKVVSRQEIPKGRPLWLSELRKEVPAGTQYEIESQFGSKTNLLKSKVASFKNNFDAYAKTCDIQKDIKIYHQRPADHQQGIASYSTERGISLTKKRVPGYSITKAKQFALWDEETQRAEKLPAAGQYDHDDRAVRQQRYSNIHMGTDIKVTKKDIKLTPGPGHYYRLPQKDPGATTHNFFAINGWDHQSNKPIAFPNSATTPSAMNQHSPIRVKDSFGREEFDPAVTKPNGMSTSVLSKVGAFTVNQRTQQPPMCTGKALAIQTEAAEIEPAKKQRIKAISLTPANKPLQHASARVKLTAQQMDAPKRMMRFQTAKQKNMGLDSSKDSSGIHIVLNESSQGHLFTTLDRSLNNIPVAKAVSRHQYAKGGIHKTTSRVSASFLHSGSDLSTTINGGTQHHNYQFAAIGPINNSFNGSLPLGSTSTGKMSAHRQSSGYNLDDLDVPQYKTVHNGDSRRLHRTLSKKKAVKMARLNQTSRQSLTKYTHASFI